VDGKIIPLDMVAKLDDAEEFWCRKKWGDLLFSEPFGRSLTPEELFIKEIDAKTGASLKLTILNPKGRVWTMVAGGGASVIYTDTICDLGFAGELANYGEYSGDPSTEDLRISGRSVIDGLCGPGTLGFVCVLAGAKEVVMNDIWLPAVENVLINLEVNRDVLGIESIELFDRGVEMVGGSPRLVGRATGACEIEVYHGDIRKLFSAVNTPDMCILDHFPGAPLDEIKRACSSCDEIVVV